MKKLLILAIILLAGYFALGAYYSQASYPLPANTSTIHIPKGASL